MLTWKNLDLLPQAFLLLPKITPTNIIILIDPSTLKTTSKLQNFMIFPTIRDIKRKLSLIAEDPTLQYLQLNLLSMIFLRDSKLKSLSKTFTQPTGITELLIIVKNKLIFLNKLTTQSQARSKDWTISLTLRVLQTKNFLLAKQIYQFQL